MQPDLRMRLYSMSLKPFSTFLNLLFWALLRLKSVLPPRQFLIVSASLVGIASGGVAVILKKLVSVVHHAFVPAQTKDVGLLLYILPFFGVLFTVLFTRYILKGDLGRGVSGILYEISQKSGYVRRHKTFSQVITSAVTVGLGGSAGLESPIVVTGSALGSNIARLLAFGYKERTLLLACGAAAGIAAVFNSPIAGVMFAIEILLPDITTFMLVPLVIAAASGAVFSNVVMHEEQLFFFKYLKPFDYKNIPYYVLLALLSGLVSRYYAKMTHFIEHRFQRSRISVFQKAILAGLLLAGLYYFFPSLFGEGYKSIQALASGRPDTLLQNTLIASKVQAPYNILLVVGFLVFVKVMATSITLSGGGNGGNFAPSLFTGAHLGFFFSRSINQFLGVGLPESNFTLVGMAGILSGVMYAPLTAIFLIAEITGGYDLIIPLMIVSTLSFAMVKHFDPYSMETRKMAEEGKIFTEDKDKNVLLLLQTTDLIEHDIFMLYPDDTLGELVKVITKSKRNIFVVIDREKNLLGILTLDDVRECMFQPEMYEKLRVKDKMKPPPATVSITDNLNYIMQKFDDFGVWNLPVVEGTKYVGFISKAGIFSKYRNQLRSMSEVEE